MAQGLSEELAVTKQVFGSEDKKEGVDAFIGKRKANFKNR
jgi:enoyl-CoA hydratase/carnithine racemase